MEFFFFGWRQGKSREVVLPRGTVKLYGFFFFFAGGHGPMDPDFFLLADMVRLREVVLPRGAVKLYGIFFPGGGP